MRMRTAVTLGDPARRVWRVRAGERTLCVMAEDAARFASLRPTQNVGRSPFPPIADYAFLSDCETNCLIAPSGAVEWMCVPRPDAPSVFGAVLDRSAGTFRIGPYD